MRIAAGNGTCIESGHAVRNESVGKSISTFVSLVLHGPAYQCRKRMPVDFLIIAHRLLKQPVVHLGSLRRCFGHRLRISLRIGNGDSGRTERILRATVNIHTEIGPILQFGHKSHFSVNIAKNTGCLRFVLLQHG